jgi:ferredoxin
MKTTLYYFTGSGNSLFVAKELQKRIPKTELVPVVSELEKDNPESTTKRIGFVFPTHGQTVPIPVKKFLKKLDVTESEYLFLVTTRGGSRFFGFEKFNKILKKKKRKLNAGFIINMYNNDPKFKNWEKPSDETLKEIERKVLKKVEAIQEVINNNQDYIEKDTDYVTFNCIPPFRQLLERLVLFAMGFAERSGNKDYFYADENCIGCGTCATVCPSGKVIMVDDEPVWQDSVQCYLCYACINYCPKEASQIKTKWYMKSYTAENDRYPHPYASAKDIAQQREG